MGTNNITAMATLVAYRNEIVIGGKPATKLEQLLEGAALALCLSGSVAEPSDEQKAALAWLTDHAHDEALATALRTIADALLGPGWTYNAEGTAARAADGRLLDLEDDVWPAFLSGPGI